MIHWLGTTELYLWSISVEEDAFAFAGIVFLIDKNRVLLCRLVAQISLSLLNTIIQLCSLYPIYAIRNGYCCQLPPFFSNFQSLSKNFYIYLKWISLINFAVNVNFITVIHRFLSYQFHTEVHVCFNN